MASPLEIFCCYARKDKVLLDELKTHLIPLQREGLISIWNDSDISPGTDWEEEITKHLDTAQLILLLVSPSFMASEYCYSKEMKRAVERHNQGKARVIPVILRPIYWQKAPFGKLQALPKDAKPVKSWRDQDKAFVDVVTGILLAIEQLTVLLPDWDNLPPLNEQLPAALPDWDDLPQLEEEEYVPELLPASSKTAVKDTSASRADGAVPLAEDEVFDAPVPSLTAQQVKDAWEKIKKRTRQRNGLAAATLTHGRVVAVEGTDEEPIVVLHFASEAHYKIVNDRSQDVEWALAVEFDKKCRVRLLSPTVSTPQPFKSGQSLVGEINEVEFQFKDRMERKWLNRLTGETVQHYKSGDKVRHDTFGEGIVLKSEMVNDTEFIEVQFEGKYGKKRLSMDFAKLEKL
jgi:hypothetical protein